MVVLLAAQSLKSGTERRKAELHLTAALEVLTETQDKLKQVTDADFVRGIAAACADALENHEEPLPLLTKQQQQSGWFSSHGNKGVANQQQQQQAVRTPEDQKLLQQERIATILQRHLNAVVGDAALTEAERDQKHVQELVVALAGDEDTLLQALQNEAEGAIVERTADGTTVIKKRVFSI